MSNGVRGWRLESSPGNSTWSDLSWIDFWKVGQTRSHNFVQIQVSMAGCLLSRSLASLLISQPPMLEHSSISLPRAAVKVTTIMFPSAEIALSIEKMVCSLVRLVTTRPSVSWKKRDPTSIPPGVNNSALGMIAAYMALLIDDNSREKSLATYINHIDSRVQNSDGENCIPGSSRKYLPWLLELRDNLVSTSVLKRWLWLVGISGYTYIVDLMKGSIWKHHKHKSLRIPVR